MSDGVLLPRRLMLFLAIAVSGCVLDLVTKHWIFDRIGMVYVEQGPRHPPIWLIPGMFGFETSLNEGALFGVGQGTVVFLVILSAVAALAILYWLFVTGAARDLYLTIALGSISAGIYGNLYDRLGLHHLTWSALAPGRAAGERVYAVRDWLHFKIDAWNFDWPIFNLADCFLVCGAALLVVHALVVRVPEPDSAGQAAAVEPPVPGDAR